MLGDLGEDIEDVTGLSDRPIEFVGPEVCIVVDSDELRCDPYLIPQAEQSVQANLEAYRVGKIDFPMLMDSVMTVLSFRKEYLGMVGESHMTKARLEAAVGRELP